MTCPFCKVQLNLEDWFSNNAYCDNSYCKYKYKLQFDLLHDRFSEAHYTINDTQFAYYFVNGLPENMKILPIGKPVIVLSGHIPVTPDNYQEAMNRINKLQTFS